MTLGDLITDSDWTMILNSVLPGQVLWDKYLNKGGSCRDTCPHYTRCTGWGPKSVCTDKWALAEPTPKVFDVLFHVLNHFDHYNRQDLPGVTTNSDIVKALREHVARLRSESSSDLDEGDPKLRSHYYRDRRSEAARRLKEQAISEERVVCAGCQIDFFEKYGRDCLALIDCHHKIPLSKAEHGGVTRIKDLVLLCANCHRLIHSPQIGLDLERLKQSISRGQAAVQAATHEAVRTGAKHMR